MNDNPSILRPTPVVATAELTDLLAHDHPRTVATSSATTSIPTGMSDGRTVRARAATTAAIAHSPPAPEDARAEHSLPVAQTDLPEIDPREEAMTTRRQSRSNPALSGSSSDDKARIYDESRVTATAEFSFFQQPTLMTSIDSARSLALVLGERRPRLPSIASSRTVAWER